MGTNTVTYLVNALEQRLKKTGPTAIVPTGANYYAYDQQGQLIGEYNATNKVISETVYLGTTPVALIKQSIAGTTTTTIPNYIYADQIDTPRVITRASDNKMQWRWDQADPFGLAPANENPQALGAFTSNARFPGQLYDKETNLHYNWHRDYDPQLGRYIQSDPIGLAGGINTFAYVGGQPTHSIDPSGLDIYVSLREGAGGFGHLGIGVNTPVTEGYYPSPGSNAPSVMTGTEGIVMPDKGRVLDQLRIPTSREQDRAVEACISRRRTQPGIYKFLQNNCSDFVKSCMESAGLMLLPTGPGPRPTFNQIQSTFGQKR